MVRPIASRVGVAALALAAAGGPPAPAPAGWAAPQEAARASVAASHAPAEDGVGAWGACPAGVYDAVEARSPRLGAEDRTRVARAILEESRAAELDPLLVVALIAVESGFDPGATSPAGATGLMQLMPPTLREVAARSGLVLVPGDPEANVRAGVRYLTGLVEAFGDLELGLVAYNAGPARTRGHLRAGGLPARFLGYPRAVLRDAERLALAAALPCAPALAN